MVMGESHGMGRSELKIETHRSCRGRGANRSILHNALHRLHRDSAGATRLSRALVSLPKEHSSKMKSLECSPPIRGVEKSPPLPVSVHQTTTSNKPLPDEQSYYRGTTIFRNRSFPRMGWHASQEGLAKL